MNAPNESGSPIQGDSANGDGSVDRTGAHRAGGRAPDAGDSPPWQRGATRASHPRRAASEPSGIDARLNRFISGTSAASNAASHAKDATQEFDAAPARPDGPPAEAYASELPDLSGPLPRHPQPKPAERAPDVTAGAPATGRSRAAESREAREAREVREARGAREPRESRLQVARRTRGPVRASMQIRRIDPWSTLKVSLLLSVALFFVWMIAVAFLYLVLGGMGVWAKLNSNVGDLLNNTSGSAGELVSSGTIFGGAVLIGLVNIVLLTAMATIAAFIYNLATDLIGGVEVTLADLD